MRDERWKRLSRSSCLWRGLRASEISMNVLSLNALLINLLVQQKNWNIKNPIIAELLFASRLLSRGFIEFPSWRFFIWEKKHQKDESWRDLKPRSFSVIPSKQKTAAWRGKGRAKQFSRIITSFNEFMWNYHYKANPPTLVRPPKMSSHFRGARSWFELLRAWQSSRLFAFSKWRCWLVPLVQQMRRLAPPKIVWRPWQSSSTIVWRSSRRKLSRIRWPKPYSHARGNQRRLAIPKSGHRRRSASGWKLFSLIRISARSSERNSSKRNSLLSFLLSPKPNDGRNVDRN